MIAIEYNFKNINEINNSITKLSDFWIIDAFILILLIILISLLILYVIPTINIYFKALKKQKEQDNKKLLLKQIIIQKEIETEIENEINNKKSF